VPHEIWLKLNAYIYGSQAFAKRFEQPSYLNNKKEKEERIKRLKVCLFKGARPLNITSLY